MTDITDLIVQYSPPDDWDNPQWHLGSGWHQLVPILLRESWNQLLVAHKIVLSVQYQKQIMKPVLSIYDSIYLSYPNMETISSRDKICANPIPNRVDCYEHKLVAVLADRATMILDQPLSDCEIFAPKKRITHVDSHGLSAMVPLAHNCNISFGELRLALDFGTVYVFDDRKPHASTGIFFMAKIKS